MQTVFTVAVMVCLAGCGSRDPELSLTVANVTMQEVEAIRTELSNLKGVREVKSGNFQNGQVSYTVKFDGKGSDLASRLSSLGSGLKNVKGFDDRGVQVNYTGGAMPAVAAAPATTPPAATGPTTPPAPPRGPPPAKTPEPAAPQAAGPTGKEVQVEVKKDPLAYKVQQLPGGTIATFEGWKFVTAGSDGTWVQFQTAPEGKENDFLILIVAGTPGKEVMANLFEEAAKFMQQNVPLAKPVGESRKLTIGGDEARMQEYTMEAQGKKLQLQSILLRKKDVAVSVTGIGTEEGFKEYGRAVGITAQSITVKEDPPDPGLVGTWCLEKYTSTGAGTSNQFSYSSSRSLTVYPNGTFTENSFSSAGLKDNAGRTDAYLEGGNRGRVVKRGNVLTFTYDNGKIWNTEFKFDGGAVWFGGNLWLKQ